MAADVDVNVIKKTQDTLGTIVKKPPLNEKLLRKPPFRFLHDIITNIISSTGFMDGLYIADELVSENVKEKEAKILFLQKALDVVTMVTGESLTARPSKIISGQEATKTNEFLQALAHAVHKKLDSSEAVKRVLNGEKPSSTEKKSSKASHQNSKMKDSEKKHKEGGSKSRSRSSEKSSDSTHKSKDVSRESQSRDTSKSKSSSKRHKEEAKLAKTTVEEHLPFTVLVDEPAEVENNSETPFSDPVVFSPPPTPRLDHIPTPMPDSVPTPPLVFESEIRPETSPVKEPDKPPSARPMAPSRQTRHRESAKRRDTSAEPPQKEKHNTSEKSPKQINISQEFTPIPTSPRSGEAASAQPVPRPQTAMRARSARPSTARPAPPRIINRNIVNTEDSAQTQGIQPITNLILDTGSKENEEDQGFMVEDIALTDQEDPAFISSNSDVVLPGSMNTTLGEGSGDTPDNEESAQQGSLVRQMLQTKKGLEGGSQAKGKGELDVPRESRAQSGRQREMTSTKELDQLRLVIQTVSRSANPLGKMLDYLQEDIDAMNVELRTWKEEHQNNLVALRREEGVTESLLDPLSKELEELDHSIQDQRDQVSALAASVLYNDERINRMLTSSHKT